MKKINELLKLNDIRALSYKRVGNVIISDTNKGKIVIKKNNIKEDIFNYLNTRNFNYYPEMIKDSEYVVSKYIEEVNIPEEQKILDLIDLIALLHSKTTHYKEISVDEYKKIYEDLMNNYEYLYEYYNDLITLIDDKVFMSSSEYLLARNISFIFKAIEYGKSYIESWYKKVENLNKMRVVVVHNKLDLSHYIKSDKDYLISWEKSKIDMPLFDLYILYNRHFMDFEFYELLNRYESIYPLKDYELELLFILINMPSKIDFTDNNYDMCISISREIDRLYKSNYLIEQYKKSIYEN